ncbi:MAG: helix-turn-helix domain-containing protein [Prevotella sp.]|nr:helix-turn-helix domain-containing protein [Prevotella sp.]
MPKHLLRLYLLMCCVLPAGAQQSTVYDDRSGLSHWIVSDVLQDRQGFIWLSTWNGLNRFDGYTFRQVKAQPGDGTSIQSEVIRRMVLDDDGNIVCCTDADLFKLDTKTYEMKDVPAAMRARLPKSKNRLSFQDREGNLWHIERYGISKESHDRHLADIVSGTENVQARAFLKDNKRRWWLATKEDECIRLYDDKNALIGFLDGSGRIRQQKTAFGYRAYCMTQTRCGDIWIGCKPGALLRLREKADGSYEVDRLQGLTHDVIYHVVEDQAGRLWLATFGDGVVCVPDPAAKAPAFVHFHNHDGLKDGGGKVRRILLTPSGNVIGATTNGVVVGQINQRDIRQSTFRMVTRDGKRAESLSNNATMDVISDKAGHLFIATENNGIDMTTEQEILADTPVFTHFSRATSSLTSDACLAMALQSDGRLMVVSTDRVMDFDPWHDRTVTYSRNFWNTASHFSEERPMQLFDGSWLFGQEQGAYIATRHSLNSAEYTPPLVFTELSINGKQPDMGVCVRDTIVLDTDERSFSISFAALDYTDNSTICYRNKLDHSDWSHASDDHSLTFFDMPPGVYVLAVQSTDRYGRWTDNTRKLVIVVKPHWYETLWARLLGWLCAIALITGVVYTVFHVRQLHRQRRELLGKYMALLESSAKQDRPTDDNNATVVLPPELPESDRKFLERVMKYVEENIANSDANIDDMAAQAATSRSSLNRKLRSLVGITAAQLLTRARMQKAQQLLRNADAHEKPNIADIAYRCGYADARYFSRCFKQKYGVSPTEYAADA